MKQQKRGFTLIEMLVVIGVIMILVALLVVGFRHINATAARKDTTVELHVCRALLTEYENHNGLMSIEQNVPVPLPNPLPRFPVYSDSVASNGSVTYYVISNGDERCPNNPKPSDMSDRSSATVSARYTALAVTRTRDVMSVLAQIPANVTTLSSVQPKRLLEPPPNPSGTGTLPPYTLDQGVDILDGWGNPIIYVPRGGMHVNIKDPATGSSTDYVVRSTGTYIGTAVPAVSKSDRPFFASAGQDGDFTQGEDNVYSFQD